MQEKIIRQLQRGDRNAFREVFDYFFNPLTAFGYRYVSDIQVVEDMVQEAFISFWEKRQDFNHIAALKSFLYTSIRNKCLNHMKHQAVEKNMKPQLPMSLNPISISPIM